jgi:hypothetical protein
MSASYNTQKDTVENIRIIFPRTRPEHVARALLIAPTAYEIPFEVASEFVGPSSMRKIQTTIYLLCQYIILYELESFLRSMLRISRAFAAGGGVMVGKRTANKLQPTGAPRSVRA